jgi:glyoxylase-like metal-dependent hydrolase (beta-lactamase superfamily II)
MTISAEAIEVGVVRLHFRSWRGSAVGYDVSAYLVNGVLVDTGFPTVRHALAELLAGHRVRGVVVTHAHEDHAGGVPALASLGLPLHVHPAVEAVLRARPGIGLYRRMVWGRPPRLTLPLVPFDPAPLEVLALPGHTANHLALWDPERRILAAGDLFLGVKVRVAHHDESPGALVRSLRRAAALEPRLLLDAHRGPVRNPVPLLRAKADWMEARMAEVTRLADSGLGERAIARAVFGHEPFVGWASRGEYSARMLVHVIRRDRATSVRQGPDAAAPGP